MRRDLLPTFVVLLGLGAVGGFAYFSQNPGSPLLESAQRWPVVGPVAEWFRTAYLGEQSVDDANDPLEEGTATPATEESAAAATAVGTPPQRPARNNDSERRAGRAGSAPGGSAQALSAKEREELTRAGLRPVGSAGSDGGQEPVVDIAAIGSTGSSSARSVASSSVARSDTPRRPAALPALRYQPIDWSWFLPGIRLHSSPGGVGGEELPTLAYLPILDRRDRWVQVVFRDEQVWLDGQAEPPHPRKGARRGLLRNRAEPVLWNDTSILRKARKVLEIEKPSIQLGAYTLYTDVEDGELLKILDGAASAAEDAYFARYARLPSGNPKRSVVLFASEATYREFSAEVSTLPGGTNWQAGHAGRGVLVMFVEGRSPEELARTLVHEIAHLLNDRALAYRLPPWLEEGLASDLGALWIEDSSLVRNERARPRTSNVTVQGAESSFLQLESALERGSVPGLATLLGLDREGFYSAEMRGVAYPMSFAFVRFLVEGNQAKYRAGFLEFLRRIAGGVQANLLVQLDVDGRALETDFRRWLPQQIELSHRSLEERFRKATGWQGEIRRR